MAMKPGLCLVLLALLAVPAGAHGGAAELEVTDVSSAYAPRVAPAAGEVETHTLYSFDVTNHGAETATHVEARVNFGARGLEARQKLDPLAPGETRRVEIDFEGAPYPYACVSVVSAQYHSHHVCGLVGDVVLP